MTTTTTLDYTPRPWNDDDRNIHDHISYSSGSYQEHIPVYKILKEMYDEDKARIYWIDSEKEHNDAMEQMWDDYYDDVEDYVDNVPTTPTNPTMSDGEYDTDYVPSDDETITVQSKFCYI